MAIVYDKLLRILESRNITSYILVRKDKVIGAATFEKIKNGGHIDTRSLDALCKYLHCQPGDLIEYRD